jgi:hypothetical protein
MSDGFREGGRPGKQATHTAVAVAAGSLACTDKERAALGKRSVGQGARCQSAREEKWERKKIEIRRERGNETWQMHVGS